MMVAIVTNMVQLGEGALCRSGKSIRQFLPHVENFMADTKLLGIAMALFGVIFCLVYPLAMVWPSGWACA
jgi:hypothetical protein